MTHSPRTLIVTHRVALLLLMLVSALAGACSMPHRGLGGRDPAGPSAPLLAGDYIATIKAPLVGEVSSRVTVTPFKGGFTALTRPNIAWSMIGGIEGLFGPMFVKSLFPDGVILVWVSGLPENGRAGEGFIGPGEARRLQVRTRMTSPEDPVEIISPDGRRLATVTLRRPGPQEPASDYPALAAGVERAIKSRLYDGQLARSGSVRSYLRHLMSNARYAHDDVEFIFGAVMAARAHVNFALPLVFRAMDPDWKTQLADLSTITTEFDPVSGVATFRADAFLSAPEVDEMFEGILVHHPRGIVIDLTNCPGVTLASLRVASWVIDHPVDAGVFFGPGARDAVKAGRTEALESLTLNSPDSVEAIENTLDNAGAARITVHPAEHAFHGPVAILTSKHTTTSAEPLVWTLKAAEHADAPWSSLRIFGQATAGRPTLSRPAEVGSGWVVWVPALDYLPPALLAGESTAPGCRPDHEPSARESTRRAALDWLRSAYGKPSAALP